MMEKGIPYFGKETQEIVKEVLEAEVVAREEVESLYDYVIGNIDNNIVVVVDNKWLTYLNDIEFNYRDKKCEIPYYTYEECYSDIKRKSDYKGHLLMEDGKVIIRYNYELRKKEVKVGNNKLVVYDLDNGEKKEITTNRWFGKDSFSIEEMYNLYLDSCYEEDDFQLTKHMGGYSYIQRENSMFRNVERHYREEKGLSSFKSEVTYKDYRDVRGYKYEEVVGKVGLRCTVEGYRERRLRFDALVFCTMRQEATPEEKSFLWDWNLLGKKKDYIKYGKGIKLILKGYWLNEHKEVKRKSWTRW